MMYEAPPLDGSQAATLENYLQAIRERVWLVAGLFLAGLILATVFASSRTEIFRAQATVVVNPSPVGSIDTRLVSPNLDREVEIVVSDGVATRAVEILGTNEDPLPLRIDLQSEFLPGSDVIKISFEDPDQERAAAVANAFATAYVEQRVEAQGSFFESKIGIISSSISELELEADTIASQIGVVQNERDDILNDAALTAEVRRAQLDANSGANQTLSIDQNALAVQVRNLRSELAGLRTDRDSQVTSAVVLSEALLPRTSQGFSTTTYSIAGALAGLSLGVALAFVLSRLDRSADNDEAVAAALGTAVIGSVPDMGLRRRRNRAVAMLSDDKSARMHRVRESYRLLRTSIDFLGRSGGYTSFLITSSHPSEGKTMTSVNLATALARSGVRVGLINADMRRPTLEGLFGLPNSPDGLSSFLGGLTDDLALETVDAVPNLFVIPAGPAPHNPGELLGSERFELLIRTVGAQVDVVLVDTPPVGSTADSAAASSAVDAVLIVVDATSTSTVELRATKADLDRAGANVIGAIINRDASRDAGLFNRRNAYSYTQPFERPTVADPAQPAKTERAPS